MCSSLVQTVSSRYEKTSIANQCGQERACKDEKSLTNYNDILFDSDKIHLVTFLKLTPQDKSREGSASEHSVENLAIRRI